MDLARREAGGGKDGWEEIGRSPNFFFLQTELAQHKNSMNKIIAPLVKLLESIIFRKEVNK